MSMEWTAFAEVFFNFIGFFEEIFERRFDNNLTVDVLTFFLLVF